MGNFKTPKSEISSTKKQCHLCTNMMYLVHIFRQCITKIWFLAGWLQPAKKPWFANFAVKGLHAAITSAVKCLPTFPLFLPNLTSHCWVYNDLTPTRAQASLRRVQWVKSNCCVFEEVSSREFLSLSNYAPPRSPHPHPFIHPSFPF